MSLRTRVREARVVEIASARSRPAMAMPGWPESAQVQPSCAKRTGERT